MSRRLKIGAIILALLHFISCRVSEKQAPRDQAERQLRVGAILDLTGPAASFGKEQREGIDLAVTEVNQSPPCPIHVSAFVEDSRLEADRAISAATKLIDTNHVAVIVSITGSSMALATARIFNRAHVPVIDSLSSAPDLTTEGGDYYFRIQPADTYAGKYLVNWTTNDLGFKSAAVIYADSDWGQGLRDSILRASQARGLSIVTTEKARLGQIDFRALILRVRQRRPDAIFLVAHPQEAGLIIKQMKELGYHVPVVGSDTLSTDEVRKAAAGALDGVKFCLASEGKGRNYEVFQTKFMQRYGHRATVNSIKPYDCVDLAVHAACESSTDPERIRKFLVSMDSFPGVSGRISFDDAGDIRDPKYDCFVYTGDNFHRID